MVPEQPDNRIFTVKNDESFSDIALDIFQFQAKHCSVYRNYLKLLKINVDEIRRLNDIPFLPIEFFKTHTIITGNGPAEIQFSSSGTGNSGLSSHFVRKLNLYEESFTRSFELFYGKPEEFVVLALLPSYLERSGSSLVYMVDKLIRASGSSESGFYLDQLPQLLTQIQKLERTKKKYILLGVTYALLDLAELALGQDFPALQYGVVMETGGMKGKRKELLKEEIHTSLKKSFGLKTIHSEYGMTELLSQAYSKADGVFTCPPWMRVLIRDTNDPFKILETGKTGGINIIDLANIHSCSFIATQDLGKLYPDNSFELLGRFDNSDIRGCNLLIN